MSAERTPPARALADAGAICALATDCNPGTSPIVSLPLIVGLAVRRYGWTVREALLACTLNAAWVLALSEELGSLDVGKRADLVVLDSPVAHVPYRFGRNPVCLVVRAGEVTWVRSDAAWRVTA
jgi:imidazolonepropionase